MIRASINRHGRARARPFSFGAATHSRGSDSHFKQPLQPSLRANGSGECPPDDRLREAIQSRNKELDCFVTSLLAMTAFPGCCAARPAGGVVRCWSGVHPRGWVPALRSSVSRCIASGTRCPDTHSRSRDRLCPRFYKFIGPPQTEGAGKTGCALHPRSHVHCASKKGRT
jgi:hypothetical protein